MSARVPINMYLMLCTSSIHLFISGKSVYSLHYLLMRIYFIIGIKVANIFYVPDADLYISCSANRTSSHLSFPFDRSLRDLHRLIYIWCSRDAIPRSVHISVDASDTSKHISLQHVPWADLSGRLPCCALARRILLRLVPVSYLWCFRDAFPSKCPYSYVLEIQFIEARFSWLTSLLT